MMTRTRNHRKPLAAGTFLVLTWIVLAGIATAAEDLPKSASSPAGPTLVSMSEEEAAGLSPLHQEMRVILLVEKDQLKILHTEFAQATDSRHALEIQRRIHKIKTGTQISLLRAQAETARAQGRLEDVALLEKSIEILADPDKNRGEGTVQATRPHRSEANGAQ